MTTRRKSTAQQVQSQQDESNDTLASSQNSQDSQIGKLRAKNYSAEESAALIRCSEKYHANISKDKTEKKVSWEKIKSEFDQYCKSQGIYVSGN